MVLPRLVPALVVFSVQPSECASCVAQILASPLVLAASGWVVFPRDKGGDSRVHLSGMYRLNQVSQHGGIGNTGGHWRGGKALSCLASSALPSPASSSAFGAAFGLG